MSHLRVLLLALVWPILCPLALCNEAVRLTTEPATIQAAPGLFQYSVSFGSLGTELVTLTIQNQSTQAIVLPEKRWLVVEDASESGQPVFTPKAPYSPLILDPGQTLTVPWRLREATEVYLVNSQVAIPRVYAGYYRAVVYYRQPTESAYRQATIPLQIHEDRLSAVWILVIVIVSIVVIVAGLFLGD